MYFCLLRNGHSKCLRVSYEQLKTSTVPISYHPSEEKRNISQRREAMTRSLHCHRVKALHGEDLCLLCSTSRHFICKGTARQRHSTRSVHILTAAFSFSFVQAFELMNKAGHKFRRFDHLRKLRGSAKTAETFCWRAVLNADRRRSVIHHCAAMADRTSG